MGWLHSLQFAMRVMGGSSGCMIRLCFTFFYGTGGGYITIIIFSALALDALVDNGKIVALLDVGNAKRALHRGWDRATVALATLT